MPIVSTNPVVVDGVEYPNFAVNLYVSPLWRDGEVSGTAALKLTPYRSVDGVVNRADEHSRRIAFDDVFARADDDAVLGESLTQIYAAIQSYITKKGLLGKI